MAGLPAARIMVLPSPPPAAAPHTLDAARSDPRRLAALRDTDLLGTTAEDCFDRLTRLAGTLLKAPVSSLTLVAEDHDFYKSQCGFVEPLASTRRLEGRSFCQFVLVAGQPLVLDDTLAHPGYADVPTVRTLGIRAYVGVPLMGEDGQCLGSFCVLDVVPRAWITQDLTVMTELAQSAMREIALRQALRLADAANQAKDAFLAHISHDLRTPLNAILGFAHLLQRSMLDERQRGQLQHLHQAGGQLLGQIDNLLDLSRMTAGKLVLEQADFPLRPLVDEVLHAADGQARSQQVVLAADLDQVPAWLRGDRRRLRQALQSLLANALRLSAPGTVVLRVQLAQQRADDLLLRFVAQPGAASGESALRTEGDDTLGLALVRRTAALMGGDCGVDRTDGPDSGLWFSAWLAPAQPPQAARSPLPAADQAETALRRQHAGARVLLVEDNLVNQEVAVALLSDAGLSVEVADDGQQAVALAPRGFDLILMDMRLPGLDGLQATRAIRAQPGGAAVPIVAMTANAFNEDRLQCLAAGMDDFLGKPVEPELLYERVLHWLQRTRH